MLCMYSGRIPADHSIQWPLTVLRFQAALVGVRWWCAQARCMGCVQNHSCPDVQDNVSNNCYSPLDSSKCLILNYFLAATYSDTFHCCQIFHNPTLSYLTSCGSENLCSKTNKQTNKTCWENKEIYMCVCDHHFPPLQDELEEKWWNCRKCPRHDFESPFHLPALSPPLPCTKGGVEFCGWGLDRYWLQDSEENCLR